MLFINNTFNFKIKHQTSNMLIISNSSGKRIKGYILEFPFTKVRLGYAG